MITNRPLSITRHEASHNYVDLVNHRLEMQLTAALLTRGNNYQEPRVRRLLDSRATGWILPVKCALGGVTQGQTVEASLPP